MHSIWETDSFYHPTDILIVGAGLTGLCTAIEFKVRNPKLSVRVVERGQYPSGASVKNAGFACFGSLSEILDDIASAGEEQALMCVKRRYLGIQKLLGLVNPTDIDYLQDDGYEIFTEKEAHLLEECKSSIDQINAKLKVVIGYEPYKLVDNTFGFNTPYPLLKIKGEGALHSGKLVCQLLVKAQSLGIQFNFGVDIETISEQGDACKVTSASHSFVAEKVIVATNGFTKKLFPEEDIIPGRGQILLTEPIPGLNMKGTFHAREGYFYFRVIGNQVLLGGGRNMDLENEKTDSQEISQKVQNALEELLNEVIIGGEKVNIARRWAGTMAFGSNNEKDPIIKEVKPNVFIAARHGGMGVAMASKFSEEVVSLVLAFTPSKID